MSVTVEIGADGKIVLVEPPLRKGLTRRAFRYTPSGALEYCTYEDWCKNNYRARFYGYASKSLPSSMING